MRSLIPKIGLLVFTLIGTGVTGYVVFLAWQGAAEISEQAEMLRRLNAPEPVHAGYGAPAESAHGGGHGEELPVEEVAVSQAPIPIVSTGRMFLNVFEPGNPRSHTLSLSLDLELFEEGYRALIDNRGSGIRNEIIQAAREQSHTKISTVGGKLYFKERIIARVNEFLRSPILRDVHITEFYLE